MRVTRLYTGDDGETHFEEIPVSLKHNDLGGFSRRLGATGLVFRVTPEAYDYDWHPAPRRQFILNINGEVEIESGGGETRRFGPGSLIFAEDLTGRGHRSRDIVGPRQQVFITVPDDFDLNALRP